MDKKKKKGSPNKKKQKGTSAISAIDELNELQTKDISYIHSGVPTKFSEIKPDDLLWAKAVDTTGLNFTTSLIKVLSVQTTPLSAKKINFKWIQYTESPWNEHRCIIIDQSTTDTPIYEHKYISDVYEDNKESIPIDKKLKLHKVFKSTDGTTEDPLLKGIKFVHTDDVNYLENLEQRMPLLQLAKSVKTDTPYHLLGSIKLNENIHTKATLDSRGIISNIMPRQQTFPLNIVPCNAPTFEHEDHWYRFVQHYKLNNPISDTDEYISKFREITDNKVYSEHFYTNPGVNPYINGPGAKSPTETLGVVTLNCYVKDIISIMIEHENVFSVSAVILLQEVSGLIPKDGTYTHLKSKSKWIPFDNYGYLPVLSESVENKISVFGGPHSTEKQTKFETDNNITRIKGSHQDRDKIQIECFDFSDSAIRKCGYLKDYEIVFTTEKLNVSAVDTAYETTKSKKLAIIVKKGHWFEMSVSILTYRSHPISSSDNTSISAIEDSIVLCLALEKPKHRFKPIIVCSAHMTAESDQNREAMNRQFYHIVLPNLKIKAYTVLRADGYVIVGNDANINNVDLTAAVQEYNSRDSAKFSLTENAIAIYEDTVIGLANNNVTTHTSVDTNGSKFKTSSYDNIVFVKRLQTPLTPQQFVYKIKVPAYVGLRLLDRTKSTRSDHSPVACRIGDVEIEIRDRKYYKLDSPEVVSITPDNLLTNFRTLEQEYGKQETKMRSQHRRFKFVTMVERVHVETLRKLNKEFFNTINSIKKLVNNFTSDQRSNPGAQKLKYGVDLKTNQIEAVARRRLNLKDDISLLCYYNDDCDKDNDDEDIDDENSVFSATESPTITSPTMRKTALSAASPLSGDRASPSLPPYEQPDGQQGGPSYEQPDGQQGGPSYGQPDGQQGGPSYGQPDGQQGGSINKIQLIKEQIKIIKDKYKNTKLDKYLIQIDNLKNKIILQTFTDKLLKIKEKIKDYKTEMKANPNKKEKYIKHIDKLVEKFNVLKQEQDILKQNIKLKHTKNPKPIENPKPTKDTKPAKDPKPTKETKHTK